MAACSTGGSPDPQGSLDGDVAGAVARLPGADVQASVDGVPTFLSGDLGKAADGKLDAGKADTALPRVLADVAPAFRLTATDLRLLGVTSDRDGAVHARFRQLQYGLDVEGAELLIHVDAKGVVYAANGSARGGARPSMVALVTADEAIRAALLSYRGLRAGPARLTFIQADGRTPSFAYALTVSGEREGEPVEDEVFVGARDGRVIAVHPLIHSARQRRITTVSNGQVLPGVTLVEEGGARPGDSHAGEIYDHLGASYDCYQTLFQRDSYDDKGGRLNGVVHYGMNTLNAYWRGNGFLVFGDGDGKDSAPFGRAYDIVAHELTHGVTGATAKLVYQNESGAINEAMSDIFGAVCETWRRGGQITDDTWKIGEDMETPGVPGDALRYMNDPAADRISRDFYRDRYAGTWDNGGVHVNSGIANLAFKLLVTGGKHPRGKSDVTVPALGMEKARAIFYRTLTVYLTSTSEYAELRASTMFTANELYGAAARDAVEQAFAAVGVGATAPGPALTALAADTVTTLADKRYGQKVFTIDVPAGTAELTVELSGGSGDPDLYVKTGAPPTTYRHDTSSTNLSATGEAVTLVAPPAGKVYALVAAAAEYKDVKLVAHLSATAHATTLASGVWTTVVARKGGRRSFTLEVPADAVAVTFELEGKQGDADLYVKKGSAPTLASHDEASATKASSVEQITVEPTPGTYHILVDAADDVPTATLRATIFTGTELTAGDELVLGGDVGTPSLYYLDVTSEGRGLEVSLTGGDGDVDIYVQGGSPATDRHHEHGSFGPTNDELVVVTRLAPGRQYITVAGNGPYKGVHLRVITFDSDIVPAHALANKRDVNVGLLEAGEARFTLEVPPVALDGTFAISGGDAEVFVRRGATATPTAFDWSGKKVELAPLVAGPYSVLVRAKKTGSSWLNATYQETPPLAAGKRFYLSAQKGAQKIFKIDATEATARGVRVQLSEGDGDADLYVKQGAVPTVTDHDGKSENSANNETVTVMRGAGTYYVMVLAADDHSLAAIEATVQK